MILESSPLAGAEQHRSEATRPANVSRFRPGGDSPPVAGNQPYSRVANEIAEGRAKDRTDRTRSTESAKDFSLWENSAFDFGDVLDIVNPLQHIPIVATVYRNLSGDRIGMAPRVIGGALWGRIGGLVSGVINSVVEWFTGKDIGDHIYAKIWRAPDASAKPAVAAKSAAEIGGVLKGPTTGRTAATVHASPGAPEDPLPLHVATVNREIDSTTAAASPIEPEGIVPRHIHHLPYRRNDDLNEAMNGAGKLDLNA